MSSILTIRSKCHLYTGPDFVPEVTREPLYMTALAMRMDQECRSKKSGLPPDTMILREFFRKVYGSTGNARIAEVLSMSAHCVLHYAARFRLRKANVKRLTPYTTDELRMLLAHILRKHGY